MKSEYSTSDNYPNPITEEEWTRLAPKHLKTLPMSAAEDIANAVSDLRKNRVGLVLKDRKLARLFLERVQSVKDVIDATVVYDGLIDDQHLGKAIHYYEDHPCIAPAFDHAVIAYQNGHGNIIVMDCLAQETNRTKQWDVVKKIHGDAPVEWDRVRWRIDVVLWVGGQDNSGRRSGTAGPMHIWQIAVYEDGEPADLHWVQLQPNYPMESWDMAAATLLGALNFLACRNVEIVEPKRPRSQARRIQRTGVAVSTINVFPMGKSYRSRSTGEPTEGSLPLTSVRGHFALYGESYGRGLLFGKYAGKFWIPSYARGSKELGEAEKTYNLRPDGGQRDDGS